MSKIQLIVEVDEELYNAVKGSDYEFEKSLTAIAHGTPLPKAHGRLIDVNSIESIMLEDSGSRLVHTKGDNVGWFIEAPTIIDAEE